MRKEGNPGHLQMEAVMLAHRITASIDKREVKFALPAAFLKRQVEIIVIPALVPASTSKRRPVRNRFHALAKNAVPLAGFTMPAREDRNER
jgi:hypothetical protein